MSYNIFPSDGDTITESDWTAILNRSNARDYVERGLTVTLNGDGTIDIGAGVAFIRDSGTNQTYPVEDESGTTGVQLADTSTTNYIYLTFDPSASDIEGSVEYHIDTDQTPPAGQPSLLIAEANESTSTVTSQNQEPSVTTEEADITNESLIQAHLSSGQSLTAGNLTTLELDTTDKDERNEFDTTNNKFVPDETGYYFVHAQAKLSVSSGDEMQCRFRDTSASDLKAWYAISASGASDHVVHSHGIFELTGGNSHVMKVVNYDSSSSVDPGNSFTFLHIRRAFR